MNIADLTKRGAVSVLPHEITLVTNAHDPSYDARVLLPIDDAAILNQAAIGITQAVTLKVRGSEALGVDGIQRTKRGLVINALNGSHPYRGGVEAVKESIARLKDTDAGKTIVGLCPAAVKLPVIVFRGDEADAFMAKVSANAIRAEDAVVERARKAQALARRFGKSNREIGIALGCSEQTAARLVARDLDAPKVTKPRSKPTGISKAKAAKVYGKLAEDEGAGVSGLAVLFGWFAGVKTKGDVLEQWPDLEKALGK